MSTTVVLFTIVHDASHGTLSTSEAVHGLEEGDEDGGIAFEDIPTSRPCPLCGARQSEFRPLGPGEE